MSNKTDDPSSSTSALSKTARAAHWITGGTDRGPTTMSSFSRMTRDRNDIKKATEAWELARKRGLDEHQGRWGRSGVLGALDQARGAAPRPRGTALIRWFRERGGGVDTGGDGPRVEPGDAAGEPEMHQQEQTGPVDSDIEDDIYGADDATGARAERDNIGDGDTAAGTVPGDASGLQQAAGGGDDDHQEGPARHAQQQREETTSPGS